MGEQGQALGQHEEADGLRETRHGHDLNLLDDRRLRRGAVVAVGGGLPAQLVTGGLSISGLFDLEPLRHTTFLQPDLKLTPASVARLSPAFFPRPRNTPLYSTVGGDESGEFIRQARLIRDVWGPTAVPVCETISATNHLTVLTGLADPGGRLHELALRLLGLR